MRIIYFLFIQSPGTSTELYMIPYCSVKLLFHIIYSSSEWRDANREASATKQCNAMQNEARQKASKPMQLLNQRPKHALLIITRLHVPRLSPDSSTKRGENILDITTTT